MNEMTLPKFTDLGRIPFFRESVRVTAKILNVTASMMPVEQKYRDARELGADGFAIEPVGNSDRLWWVEHDDGVMAVYYLSELTPDDLIPGEECV